MLSEPESPTIFLSDVLWSIGLESSTIQDRLTFMDFREMANAVEGRVTAACPRMKAVPSNLKVAGRRGDSTTFSIPAGGYTIDADGILSGEYPCPVLFLQGEFPPTAKDLRIEVFDSHLEIRVVIDDGLDEKAKSRPKAHAAAQAGDSVSKEASPPPAEVGLAPVVTEASPQRPASWWQRREGRGDMLRRVLMNAAIVIGVLVVLVIGERLAPDFEGRGPAYQDYLENKRLEGVGR